MLIRAGNIVIDIVAYDRVKGIIGEVQLMGVPVLKPAPGRYTLTGGVLLAHGLAVAVCHAPIVDTGDLRFRPGEGRPDGQGAGAAAHIQQRPLAIEAQVGEQALVGPLHHPTAAESVLFAYPAAPTEQGQKCCGGHRKNRS